jgi:hypothetical protein
VVGEGLRGAAGVSERSEGVRERHGRQSAARMTTEALAARSGGLHVRSLLHECRPGLLVQPPARIR